MKLSALIIVKNEEAMIKDCLESVKFCDEIVVIDDGSTDKTVEISKKYTEKVFTNDKKSMGFVEAVRQFGVSKTQGEWVLILDADERVSIELKDDIEDKLGNQNKFVAFNLIRKNFYFGKNEWPQKDKLERLFRRDKILKWEWKLHTSPVIEGQVGELSGFLLHYTHRDLASMLAKTISWSKQEAELRFKADHPKMTWWRFPRVMLSAFLNSYVKQGGWRVGTAGVVESMYQGFSAFVTYARLWEMQRGIKD